MRPSYNSMSAVESLTPLSADPPTPQPSFNSSLPPQVTLHPPFEDYERVPRGTPNLSK